MNDLRAEEYELGEDVTAVAAPKNRRGTAVLSVRLGTDEIRQIESVAMANGKTVSQVVRDAVQRFLHAERQRQPVVTVSWRETTLSWGEPEQRTGSRGFTLELGASVPR